MRRASFLVASWIACGVALAAVPTARAADERPGALGAIAVPGGADALAAAAGLPVPAPRSTVALEVIRRLHGAAAGDPSVAARRQAVTAVLAQPASADTIPLPFDAGLWSRVIFSRKVTPEAALPAILTTPRGAWFYYGAAGLDEETRAWFRARPHRLLRIGAQVGAFAAFGPSLEVRGERIASPGGPAADPIWEGLVGASPANADAFVDKVLEARFGRVAWLYDTVARLDPAMQRHLLTGDGALDRLRRLADVFARVNVEWRIEDRPLWRPLVEPATLLLALEARPDGTLLMPEPAAWAGVFGKTEQVDAAWIVDRVFSGDNATVRDRVDLALFALRRTRDGREPVARAMLDLFVEAPALALSLERIGAADTGVATRLVGLLQRSEVRGDTSAMRLLQASLALVERSALAGGVDASAAPGLLTALADRVDADGVGRGVRTWLAGSLAPVCPAAPAADAVDAALAGCLAGRSPAAPVRVEWEGQAYGIDRAASVRARIERVREAQGRPSLDAGLRGDDGALGDALLALIYASALPATDPELLASGAEKRHGFGAVRGAHDGRAWRLAEASSGAGVPWHLDGSLLGLDVALAVPALRRVSDEPPAPVLPPADRVAFARTVALMRRGLTDASRDRVLALIAAGRKRLGGVSGTDDARALAVTAGLSPWRREAIAWAAAHDATSVSNLLSLSELAWAADPTAADDRAALDAWGTAQLAATGELATRAPRGRGWEIAVAHDARAGLATSIGDLNLRVAAFLAARGLPASIAPDVLSAATLDLVDRVPAPRADDWRAVVAGIRAMPEARLEDDVAALTADGPLRPMRDRETGQ